MRATGPGVGMAIQVIGRRTEGRPQGLQTSGRDSRQGTDGDRERMSDEELSEGFN